MNSYETLNVIFSYTAKLIRHLLGSTILCHTLLGNHIWKIFVHNAKNHMEIILS
jgi:hypothetical protein